jgi:predicted signal transduction protein with EAL and GGDEF domain
MLPDTDEQDAIRVAERLRTAFAATVHAVGGRAVTATVSVGFACSDGADSDVDALLKAAVEALYRAKIAGRNRVKCAWQGSPAQPAKRRASRRDDDRRAHTGDYACDDGTSCA